MLELDDEELYSIMELKQLEHRKHDHHLYQLTHLLKNHHEFLGEYYQSRLSIEDWHQYLVERYIKHSSYLGRIIEHPIARFEFV